MDSSWIPLTEYSSKYQVSISTLRRRIKTDDIKYQFADGKYLLLDEPQKHRPSQAIGPSLTKNHQQVSNDDMRTLEVETSIPHRPHSSEEPVLTVANRLLNELKKAYSQILQEKEEQILRLKEEQADLKTLVRVLEAENERISKKMLTN